MAFLSTRDRRIELIFLALWLILAMWALADRFRATTVQPWQNGFLSVPASAILASASRFADAAVLRWSLMIASLIVIAIGLVVVFP